MFNPEDAIRALAIFVFVFWQKYRSDSEKIKEIYEKKRKFLCCSPPPWFFGILWFLLFGCMFVSGYFFLYTGVTPLEEGQLIGLFITYFVSVYLTKDWMVWFFDYEKPLIALFIDIINILAIITYIALTVYNKLWISFGTILPVLIQLFIALIWNWQWINNDEYEKSNTKKRNEQQQTNIRTTGRKLPAIITY